MSFIQDLSPPVLQADFTVAAQRDDVFRRLIAMRDGAQASHGDVVGFFDACISLIHLVPNLDGKLADEVSAMARRLVEIAGEVAEKDSAPQPPESPEDSEESRLGGDSLLGEILVHFGLATQKQIAQALTNQAIKPRRLGKVIVEMGVASSEDVLNALRLQRDLTRRALKEMRSRRPAEDFKLGQLLVRRGYLGPETLVEVLHAQTNYKKRIGEILVEHKLVTQEQLDEVLQEQQELRERKKD